MSKLYVGHLSDDATEGALRQLLLENDITYTSVLLKRRYAFIDFAEQSFADRAIDKLDGLLFLGSTLIVQPSVGTGRKRRYGRNGWWDPGAASTPTYSSANGWRHDENGGGDRGKPATPTGSGDNGGR